MRGLHRPWGHPGGPLQPFSLPSPPPTRMESTEKCEAVITHFNGKYIKTPPGVPGRLGGHGQGGQGGWVLAGDADSPPHSPPGPAAVQVCRWGAEETTEPGQVCAQWESLGPGQ